MEKMVKKVPKVIKNLKNIKSRMMTKIRMIIRKVVPSMVVAFVEMITILIYVLNLRCAKKL